MSLPWTSFCGAVANDALLASILLAGPIRNEGQERRLTALRRRALFEDPPPELLAHLAIQCFMNEFAWRVTPEEAQRVEALAGRTDPQSLLRVACYRRLTEDHAGPEALRAVVRVQVLDVAEERRLAAEVAALTPIAAGVSEAVRAMYEENPYPRWNTLAAARPQTGPADVLVAGCGTGRHALHTARRYPQARVLAVDLSRASLGYAMRKTAEAGVGNIEYGQADLLRLPALGRTFDIVESVGTLPCMDDPGEGLAALVAMMRPDARLRLGLYSEAARAPLAPAMALGRACPATADGIRALRQRVLDAPEGDPLRGALGFSDFYAISGCRDLLLHVKEHRHTLPQVAALLDGAGLRFAGFDLPDGVRDRFRAAHDDELDLGQWAAFEEANPTTFRGMYQLWARRA